MPDDQILALLFAIGMIFGSLIGQAFNFWKW